MREGKGREGKGREGKGRQGKQNKERRQKTKGNIWSAVSWDSIGGLEDVKARLRQAVEWPLQHTDAFLRLGLTAPRGVLLHGPPGMPMTLCALIPQPYPPPLPSYPNVTAC